MQGEVVGEAEPIDLVKEALSKGVTGMTRAKPMLNFLIVDVDHCCHWLSPMI